MLMQDWTQFAYQAGPYMLGCASKATQAEDARTVEGTLGALELFDRIVRMFE